LVALEALVPLVAVICHFPSKYVETDCRVCGLIIGSKGGADTIVLDVRKGLDDAAKEFKFKTPERLLAHPEEEGTYTPPLKEAEAALVYTMIEEAKSYIRGERAHPEQGRLINIEVQQPAPAEKPKRGRKPKAEAPVTVE
jgi:hypothetical protein